MKVLFLGNSHTYFNDMPHTFARLCAAATGETPEVTMLAYSGRSLQWHMNEYFSLRFNLLYGGYDYCVIQQQGHPFPGREALLIDGGHVAELCRTGGVKPVPMTTWAERVKPEIQPEISDAYRAFAVHENGILAPVGEIWEQLLQTHPEIDLFWQDGEHASPYGDYLIAVTVCAVLTGCDPETLPTLGGDFLKGLQPDFSGQIRVIEDPALVNTSLDETACAAIRSAVKQRLTEK